MARIYEAVVQPHHGGGGMYQRHCEGPHLVDDCESVADWVALAESNGYDVAPAPELDGRIYDQNGGRPYRVTDSQGNVSYTLVYAED